MIIGLIDDNARFLGANKFAGDADKPNWFWYDGTPKSLTPELNMMPVLFPDWPQPKLQHTIYNINFLVLKHLRLQLIFSY